MSALETSQASPSNTPSPEQLKLSLASQRGPLSHVESAFGQGWKLIGEELESARQSGTSPNQAWQQSFKLLKELRGQAAAGQTPAAVEEYRQELELQEKGLGRLADDPFSDQSQYLTRMGDHFRPLVERMRGFESQCLEVSGTVGAEAMHSGDERLSEMDQTMTLLGMSLASVVGRGDDYLKKLNGPELQAPAQAAETTVAEPREVAVITPQRDGSFVPDEALLAAGPRDHTPQGLKDYYRAAYGVDLDFGSDGRPLLAPIDGPVRGTMPQVGPGFDRELEHSLSAR